jgi:hypothetical protein
VSSDVDAPACYRVESICCAAISNVDVTLSPAPTRPFHTALSLSLSTRLSTFIDHRLHRVQLHAAYHSVFTSQHDWGTPMIVCAAAASCCRCLRAPWAPNPSSSRIRLRRLFLCRHTTLLCCHLEDRWAAPFLQCMLRAALAPTLMCPATLFSHPIAFLLSMSIHSMPPPPPLPSLAPPIPASLLPLCPRTPMDSVHHRVCAHSRDLTIWSIPTGVI